LRDNIFFVQEVSAEHGGFGKFLDAWPMTDQIGLMAYLKAAGSRLGGQSALWFLRRVGKDCFILSRDVVTTLRSVGLEIAEQPTSKRDLKQVQEQFNSWHLETGLPYSHLSRIAACSVGESYL
jgi:3-methyladenine DNA glycosylase Tag